MSHCRTLNSDAEHLQRNPKCPSAQQQDPEHQWDARGMSKIILFISPLQGGGLIFRLNVFFCSIGWNSGTLKMKRRNASSIHPSADEQLSGKQNKCQQVGVMHVCYHVAHINKCMCYLSAHDAKNVRGVTPHDPGGGRQWGDTGLRVCWDEWSCSDGHTTPDYSGCLENSVLMEFNTKFHN